jgi:hypothetical protein
MLTTRSIAAGLGFALVIAGMVAVSSGVTPLSAQTEPTPAPSAVPSPAASPRPHFFVAGSQFIAVGVATTPNVSSEFVPNGASSMAALDVWQTGETTIAGRFHIASYSDIRNDAYTHLAGVGVTTIGGAGTAFVPGFTVHDNETDSGGGIDVAPHLFAGMTLFRRTSNTGYPPLSGIGYDVMLTANSHAFIAPYGWFAYFPNVGGIYALANGAHTALTYRAAHYRAGILIGEPHTRLYFDLGYLGEDLHGRSNAPATIRTSAITAGIAFRY